MNNDNTEKLYDLFISYNWSDEDIVDTIESFIKNNIPTIRIFRDKSKARQGEKLLKQLEESVRASTCLLCMCSKNLLCSANCYREWKWAEKYNVKRFPVILPPENLAMGYVLVEQGDDLYCVWKTKTTHLQFIKALSDITGKPIRRKTFNVNGVEFDMVLITPNNKDKIQFNMGSNSGYANEKPVHTEIFNEYYIGETTVTQALWHAVMGGEKPKKQDMGKPKVNIDYTDWADFISKLNKLTSGGFRVPFENEWEYAARVGNECIDAENCDINHTAWHKDNSNGVLHLAKEEAIHRNALGLYNMLGNVWEWCKNKYYDYPAGEAKHPIKVPHSNDERVIRGGSYKSREKDCTVSRRLKKLETTKDAFTGLRLALSSTKKQ